MTVRLRVALASTVLVPLLPVPLHAQCADGTPPPCGVPVAPPAVTQRAEPPPEALRARSFLVLPFRNVRGIAEDDWLGESPVMLGHALGQWQEISVVSDERLYAALRRHGITTGAVADEAQVRRVAEETGGWTAVTGEVLRIGRRIQITARALDVATNRVVVRVREQADSEEGIQELYERLAVALLETVGVDASGIDLSSVTTGSIDALKAYTRGLRHYHRYEMQRARDAFGEAVRHDSTFARAYLKLAESWLLFTSIAPLNDGTHPAYGHLSRAVALSDGLPPRERQYLRAMDAFFHGQFAAAREQLDDLLARDSTDVDVLIGLAWVESLDGILVRLNGTTTVRGSFNRANDLAKMAVLLDPSRSGGYGILVKNYLMAAGWVFGVVPTAPRESASLPAYLMSGVTSFFPHTPVLRDTLEVIPMDLDELFSPIRDEARARALAVAKTWMERWLVATPSVAEAHVWAAAVLEMDESYDRALDELHTADSLGVETELEDLTARRMVLLAKAGRRVEALHLADSLADAGIFSTDRFVDPFLFDHGAAAIGLYLAHGNWRAADEVIDALVTPLRAIAPALVEMVVTGLCSLGPRALRREALLRILAGVHQYPSTTPMQNCLTSLLRVARDEGDPAFRAELAARALDAADSLVTRAERPSLARALALRAFTTDSTAATAARALAIFKRLTELDPEDVTALYQVGRMALFAQTELELAIRSFTQFLERAPQEPALTRAAAHWRLGMIFELREDFGEARAHYEAALELDPTFERARAALGKLARRQ